MRLECQYSRETRKSKGQKSISTEVKWQDMLILDSADISDRGDIAFLFDVPADLPPTQPKSSRWHHWQIQLAADIPGLDISLDFDIPVTVGDQKSTIMIPGREQRLQLQRAEQLIQALNVEQLDDTIYINSVYGRELAGSVFCALFGAVFLSVGMGIFFTETGASMMLPIKLIFVIAFGGIGLLLFLAGLLTPTTKLDTAIDAQGIHVRRIFLGWEIYRRTIALDSANNIEIHKNSSFSGGKRTRNWFQLRVLHNGKRQVIAESIPGRVLADAALAFLRSRV